MKNKVVVILVTCMMLAVALTGCGGGAESGDGGETAPKIGLILGSGGLGDQSFNDLSYEGVVKAESELGIEFDYVEPISVADYETQQKSMAGAEEYELIICVGFDQAAGLEKVSADYPDQKFMIIDMVVDMPNVASYVSKEEEGSFLVGALAGLLEADQQLPQLDDNPVLGVVGALDIPLINKFIVGFEAGAEYVNPDVEIIYDYVGDFSDPTTAKEIALVMNQKSADIIYHAAGGSGLGVFNAAEANDFIAIGVNSNQNYVDPDHIVASMMKRVDIAAFSAIKDTLEGNFTSGIHVLGLKESGVGYTFDDSNVPVPEEIKAQLEELRQKIIDGDIVVPTEK